jgi:hypothetical protein
MPRPSIWWQLAQCCAYNAPPSLDEPGAWLGPDAAG